MSLLFPFAPPLADWSGPGPWILLVPLVWFGFALLFVFVLRRFVWGRGWGPGGCGRGPARRDARHWEEDDTPSPPGAPWRP
jgi:putative membrane protein